MNVETNNPVKTITDHFPDRVGLVPMAASLDGMEVKHGMHALVAYDTRLNETKIACPHSVSSRFGFHQTSDLLPLVDAFSDVFGDACNVNCYWKHGQHIIMQPSNDMRETIFDSNKGNTKPDTLAFRLCVSARYDKPLVFTGAGFRDACRNLLMPRTVEGITRRVTHHRRIHSNISLVTEEFKALKDKWSVLVNWAKYLESKTVMLEDVVKEVYGQVETTRQADRNNKIFQRAISESIAIGREIPDSDYGYRTTAWQALQAIQGYEQHTASRRGNPGTNARAWMVQGNRHVSRAERVVAA